MARVYKKTRKKNGRVVKERHYTIIYWDAEAEKERKVPGYSDKEASLAKGRALERAAERRSQGLDVPEAAGLSRSAADVEAEYVADMRQRGKAESTLKNVGIVLGLARAGMNAVKLRDLTPKAARAWLAALQTAGRAPGTRNVYLGVVRTFLNWCVRTKQIAENPLAGLGKSCDPRDERPARRRALSAGELTALLAYSGLRGHTYALAAWTGFRRRTLRFVERRHLDLTDPGRPLWRLSGTILKGRRPAVLPVVPEALAVLRARFPDLDTLAPSARLCDPKPPWKGRFDADLAAAGITRAKDGRRIVFHSLRYTFCVRMADRLPIQRVKVLMCHRTLAMTADLYGDLGLSSGEDAWSVPAA